MQMTIVFMHFEGKLMDILDKKSNASIKSNLAIDIVKKKDFRKSFHFGNI